MTRTPFRKIISRFHSVKSFEVAYIKTNKYNLIENLLFFCKSVKNALSIA